MAGCTTLMPAPRHSNPIITGASPNPKGVKKLRLLGCPPLNQPARSVLTCQRMEPGVLNGLSEIWREKPDLVLLTCIGFSLFVFLVVDAWRFRHLRRHR